MTWFIGLPSLRHFEASPAIARRRRKRRPARMLIDGADPFTALKPDARLIKLLVRAHRFNTTLVQSDGVAFAALAVREGVSRSYFTRVVRLAISLPTSPKRSSKDASPAI
jgi:hypothetical protein